MVYNFYVNEYMQAPYVQVEDVNFRSPLACDSPWAKNPAKIASPPTSLELDRLYSQLQSANPNACILSVVPGYSGAFVPTIRLSTLPPLMSSYFSAEKMDLPFSDLIEQCDTVFNSLCVTSEQAQNLEMKTREQSKSKLWNKYRAGRVTASIFKQVSVSDPSNPSITLIRKYAIQTLSNFIVMQQGWYVHIECFL